MKQRKRVGLSVKDHFPPPGLRIPGSRDRQVVAMGAGLEPDTARPREGFSAVGSRGMYRRKIRGAE